MASTTRRSVIRDPINLKRRANLQGETEHFKIYAQPSLGASGEHHAQIIRARCEADYAKVQRWFGGIEAGPFSVILFWYPDGAYHNACASTNLFCDSPIQHPRGGEYSMFLTVMEMVEVFESRQNNGWGCGKCNGEGMSRVLGAALYPHLLDGFASAKYWLDSARHNFVDHNLRSDVNGEANGCAVLFLNWLHHGLRHPWQEIVGAGGPNLGATYKTLTGRTDGFERFCDVINKRFPHKSGLRTDNPF